MRCPITDYDTRVVESNEQRKKSAKVHADIINSRPRMLDTVGCSVTRGKFERGDAYEQEVLSARNIGEKRDFLGVVWLSVRQTAVNISRVRAT